MRRRRLLISLNVSFNIMLSTSKFRKKKLFRSDFTAHVKSLNAYYSKPTLCDLGTFCTKRFIYNRIVAQCWCSARQRSASRLQSVWREFLRLLAKHFPPHHRLHKVCNNNNMKVSYSCMPNVATIISKHIKSCYRTGLNLLASHHLATAETKPAAL